MTAKEYLDDVLGWECAVIPEPPTHIKYTEVIEYLKEFAKIKCMTQRQICYDNAKTKFFIKSTRKGSRYKPVADGESFDIIDTIQMTKIDKNSILNAPEPTI